ncbi:MAG: hypothetical protein JWO32_299 [Bacteroidetes bacterium]|nr:hypothetical protein [Bacteroidota bacterium]
MKAGFRRFIFLLIFLSVHPRTAFTQKPVRIIDSLNSILKGLKKNQKENSLTLDDTSRIKILNRLAYQYFRISDNDNMYSYVSHANEMCLKLIGNPSYSGNYTLKRELALSYQYLSNYYETSGLIPKAFENYFKSLNIREEIGDIIGIAESNNNGGNLYKEQGNLSKALELYNKVRTVRENIQKKNPADKSNIKGLAGAYNNIGLIYKKQRKYNLALGHFFNALKLKKEISENLSAANSLANIGSTYSELKNYSLSQQYCFEALAIYKNYNDKRGEASVYFNMAQNYVGEASSSYGTKRAAKILEGTSSIEQALTLAKQINDASLINDCYQTLSTLSELKKDYAQSLLYYKHYIHFRDSVTNTQSTQNSVRAEMNNEFDKKTFIARHKQEANNAIQQQEHAKQKSLRNLFIIAFVLMLILAAFIFIIFRQKHQDNELISKQKQEVESQKALAEQKQKQILDSINYAERIQASILPHHENLKAVIPENFILYNPKDIVSGDFYWYYALPGSQKILIAVADCTGHGVPGAFLSMVGSTLLNDIVVHKNITDPAQIITELSYSLSLTLINKEKNDAGQDGMDITVCVVDVEKQSLTYCSANQCIYTLSEKGLTKLDPQIKSADGIFNLKQTITHNSIEIKLEKDAAIYLCTDGYAEQHGEAANEKFNINRLEGLLGDVYKLSCEAQKEIIEKTFADWKGNASQADDVLIIGLKV